MAALSKEAKLRAIEDELPIEMFPNLIPAYVSPDEIADVAHEALFGRSRKDDEGSETGGEGSYGGINRYIFVTDSAANAFIDPAGTLLHTTRQGMRQLRRARGADPAGYRVRPKSAYQKRQAQHAPQTTG